MRLPPLLMTGLLTLLMAAPAMAGPQDRGHGHGHYHGHGNQPPRPSIRYTPHHYGHHYRHRSSSNLYVSVGGGSSFYRSGWYGPRPYSYPYYGYNYYPPVTNSVVYQTVPVYTPVPVTVPQAAQADTTSISDAEDGRYCREYQKQVTVGGKQQDSYGRACMQPDGSWEEIS